MPSRKATLAELTIREKIEFARRISEAVPARPALFPSPPFPQIEVETAMTKLAVAYDAVRLARMIVSRKDELLKEAEAELDLLLRQQVDYIESASRGNDDVLRNMGLGGEFATGPGGDKTEQWW